MRHKSKQRRQKAWNEGVAPSGHEARDRDEVLLHSWGILGPIVLFKTFNGVTIRKSIIHAKSCQI